MRPSAKALAVLLSRKALAAVLEAFDPQPRCYWPMKVIMKIKRDGRCPAGNLGNRG